uniref:Uncharacterized protein n=1 Tax=Arundo donax TaxID=35708 RepID=A0A0A9G0I6_ARUDO
MRQQVQQPQICKLEEHLEGMPTMMNEQDN